MIVDMWMTRGPITVAPTASISQAALLMVHHGIRRLVVVERDHGDERVVGMVSAGDVARAFPPDLNPVSAAVSERSVPAPVTSVMTRGVYTIATGAAIEDAAYLLRTHKIGALPVMQGARLVGIVTGSDVFRAFAEMSDEGTPGVGITFDLGEDEDPVATMTELGNAQGVRIASLFSFHHVDARSGQRSRFGVMRLAGEVPERLLDAIWRSHHRVVAVVRRQARGD